MNESPDDVIASYHRCRSDDGFVDTFYDIFLSKSPEIREKFANTDFKHQKLMLRESLLEMLFFDQGMSGARQDIEKLGRRHRDLAITDEMYEMWLDALCEAIRKHDPKYTADLEKQWRSAMLKGIEVMKSVGE